MTRTFWTVCLVLVLGGSLRAAAPPQNAPLRVTSYAQMTADLDAEAKQSPLVRVVSIGKSAGGQRDLWLARLADPAADVGQTMRLLVLCRQHGDEPASTESVLRLIRSVASGGDPALRSELAHVTLYIIPMVNPDGAGAGTRVNHNHADLNRDWGLFKQPETRAVAKAAALIHPALVVDAHNWDGNDEYDADCIEIPREMESRPGRAIHAMQQQAVRDLAVSGYSVHPTAWGEDTDLHLAHRWFTHQNITSLLVETHYGSPANKADFERREGIYSVLIHSLARRYAAPWTLQASRSTQEAKIFAAPAQPGTARLASAKPLLHSSRWLWAFGLYGLALWGMSLRGRSALEADLPEPAVRKRPPARYSYSRKRDKTETISRSGHRKAVSLPPR